jgi:hypothetical protein
MADDSAHAKAHQAIGAYVCAYSDASHELGETLKTLLRITENEMADAIIASLGDFARQASLVAAVCGFARDANGNELSKRQKQQIEQTINELFSCNTDRVIIAHAKLRPRQDGSVEMEHTKVDRGMLKRRSQIWSKEDLIEKTEKLKKLAERLRLFQSELKTFKIAIPEGEDIKLEWFKTARNTFHSPVWSDFVAGLLGAPWPSPGPNKSVK